MSNDLYQEEILSRLFGSISRVLILEFLLSNAGRSFYQREIMFETGLTLQPTQRELKNLFEIGIIKRQEVNNRVYYEINTSSQLFNPLSEIFRSFSKLNKGYGDFS